MRWQLKMTLALLVAGAVGLFGASPAGSLTPRKGRGTPPPNARGSGPWMTRVMLATSSNGLDFARLQFVLSDQAGVPNVMVGGDGLARVYYIDYGNGNVIARAQQQRAGSLTNWSYEAIRIADLPSGKEPVDPSVVLLPDNRYRLYFMQARPRPTIYSAISTNGADFTFEPGVRFPPSSGGSADAVFDPVVVATARGWRLWCGPDGNFSGISRDGLTFDSTGPLKVEGARFMPWSAVALPANGGYRLYGNFLGPGEWSGGISSVVSTDGERWKREPGIRLSLDGSRYPLESAIAPDNGCARLNDGTYLLAYLATIPMPRSPR